MFLDSGLVPRGAGSGFFRFMKYERRRTTRRREQRERARLPLKDQLADRLETENSAGPAVLSEVSHLREGGDRCLCEDEIKNYTSNEEAAADTSPKITCADCGKQKLRVKWVTDTSPSDSERVAFASLLEQSRRNRGMR